MSSVGEYELEGQIGAGASGTVWKAFRRGPVTRPVAVKRFQGALSPTDLEAIRWEVSVLAELDHPHIVRVLEVLEDNGALAVAMQLAPGGSLAGLLVERGRLTPGQVVAVAAPIAVALASAHRRGVVHSDVKPANILFTSDGEPLLSDFGVSRALNRPGQPTAGTPAYLAPELLVGGAPEPRADVYSLGVLCYEALTGRLPYEGATPMDVIAAADRGEHEALTEIPGIPTPLGEAVERAMARDPARRFATAEELATTLRAAVPSEEIRLPGTPAEVVQVGESVGGGTTVFGPRPQDALSTPPPPPPSGPSKLFIGGLAALIVAAVAGAAFLILDPLGGDDEQAEPIVDQEAECPDVTPPEAAPGVEVLSGDPEGDGCEVFGVVDVRLSGGREVLVLSIPIEGEEVLVGLGTRGDQLFLGDWDCDGADTPALYMPRDGRVEYYNSWPSTGAALEPDHVVDAPVGGTAQKVPGAGAEDCDLLGVERDESGEVEDQEPDEVDGDPEEGSEEPDPDGDGNGAEASPAVGSEAQGTTDSGTLR